jgi:signal transduction histidine kinase
MVSQQLLREVTGLDSIPEEHLMSFLQLAHELRSPLAAVLHCLDVVLQGYTATDPALQNELLNRARERAAGMLAQVNDFLRLGAVRHEELMGNAQPVQLLDVVDKLAPEMRVRARWRAVNLNLDLPDSLPLVKATYQDMEHLLSNLMNNGIKYTNPGGSVTLLLRQIDSGVLGRVIDTGIGIAAQDLPHVFDEFYRAENARSMDNQGTGLGLAIARRVVDRCGGWIRVESELGQGSAFSFFLPGVCTVRFSPS